MVLFPDFSIKNNSVEATLVQVFGCTFECISVGYVSRSEISGPRVGIRSALAYPGYTLIVCSVESSCTHLHLFTVFTGEKRGMWRIRALPKSSPLAMMVLRLESR